MPAISLQASRPSSPLQASLPTRGTMGALSHRTSASQPAPKEERRKPQPVQNRVHIFLVHIPRLSIRGQARLAAEVGVSRSTVSRLVNEQINPSYRLARGITSALERLLGYPLDMRDVFSTDGTYPTASGCGLCKCGGCLPDDAYSPEGDLRPEWRGQKPGDWSVAPSANFSSSDLSSPVKENALNRSADNEKEMR